MKMSKSMRLGCMWMVSFTLTLWAIGAMAQVDTGTILGTITDATGAVVPGANVTIFNLETSAMLTAKTSADGRFEFTPLHIGSYRVEVENASFKKAIVQSVHLNIQEQAV